MVRRNFIKPEIDFPWLGIILSVAPIAPVPGRCASDSNDVDVATELVRGALASLYVDITSSKVFGGARLEINISPSVDREYCKLRLVI